MYRSVYFSMTRTLRCWCILDVVEILAPLHGGLYFVLTSGCDVTVTQTWLVIGQAKRTSMPLLPPQIKRCFWGRIIYHHIRSVPESNMFFWPSTSAFPQQHLPDLERGRGRTNMLARRLVHVELGMLHPLLCKPGCLRFSGVEPTFQNGPYTLKR